MRRVGSVRVSAITKTPASGPRAPVTTPPMSSLSMAGAAGCCCAAVTMTATAMNTPAKSRINSLPAGADTTPTGLKVALDRAGHAYEDTFRSNPWNRADWPAVAQFGIGRHLYLYVRGVGR